MISALYRRKQFRFFKRRRESHENKSVSTATSDDANDKKNGTSSSKVPAEEEENGNLDIDKGQCETEASNKRLSSKKGNSRKGKLAGMEMLYKFSQRNFFIMIEVATTKMSF